MSPVPLHTSIAAVGETLVWHGHPATAAKRSEVVVHMQIEKSPERPANWTMWLSVSTTPPVSNEEE